MEVSRSKIENGVAYLCSYISSLQLRGDTQASLLLGISVGVVVVIFVAAFPGKPIDYSGVGEWDPSQLDEDRLARRMSSSKAARMLGLTEDQVRRVVLDTKQELQQKSRGEGHAAPGSRHEDGSAGLSRAFSTVLLVTGLGVFWLFVWTHPHGPLARFLIGAFPREMETLGFIHDRMS